MRTRLQVSQKLWVSGVMKPSRAAGLRDRHVARRPAGLVVAVGQSEALGDPRPHHGERQVLVEPAFADVAERHHLDEGEVHAGAMRPFDERDELVLVDALERDRVDLHREAGVLGGLDAVEHLVEVAPARDRAEFGGIERVERDVDALHAVGGELAGVFSRAGSRWWSA